MPLRRCDFPGCSNAVERDRGNCMICSSHRCIKHLDPEFHACPREDDDPDAFFVAYDSAKEAHLQAFLKNVNLGALRASASRCHDNVQCSLPAVTREGSHATPLLDSTVVSAQMGGQNCHLDIRFEDGVEWIARLRLEEPTLPPCETQERIFTSEVNTLHFLAQTSLPVPKVFYHTFDKSEIGTPFVLMEKMPGRPLQWSEASAQQKTRVMRQLIDVFLELERHPLPATGSLSDDGLVGPFAQSHMFESPSQSIGPFDSLEESMTSILEHEIEMIEAGELGTFAVDNYLTHVWRLEQVPNLVAETTDTHFYVKHFDDKGDHILVDGDYNITGIIDWEFASMECKQAAFSSPCMMWPVGDFYDGSNQLSTQEVEFADMFRERGRDDMANMILQGRKWQRFMFFLGSNVSAEREEFEALFQGLRKVFEGQNINSYAEWKAAAIAKASKDPVLKRLIRAEQRTISN